MISILEMFKQHDRVVVLRYNTDEKTSGGIILLKIQQKKIICEGRSSSCWTV